MDLKIVASCAPPPDTKFSWDTDVEQENFFDAAFFEVRYWALNLNREKSAEVGMEDEPIPLMSW